MVKIEVVSIVLGITLFVLGIGLSSYFPYNLPLVSIGGLMAGLNLGKIIRLNLGSIKWKE